MIRKEKLEELKGLVEELKTIEVKRNINNNPFLKTELYDFQLNNGTVISREKLIKGNSNGSAAIIMPVCDKEILVVIEPRVFTKLTVGVGFPAGYIEKNENALEGALRELKEETGLVPKEMILLDTFYQDEGCSQALNHIYLATNCKKIYEQSLDESEIIKYMKFTFEEILELEKLGYIMGGNNKLAIEKAKTIIKKYI